MHKKITDAICAAYGLVTPGLCSGFASHVAAVPDAVGAVMWDYRGVFVKAVAAGVNAQGPLLGRMKGLVAYLNNGAIMVGSSPDSRAMLLARFNAIFLKTWVGFDDPLVRNLSLFTLGDLINELEDTGFARSAAFIAYRGAVANCFLTLLEARRNLLEAGGAATTYMTMIEFFHRNGYPFDRIKPENLLMLDKLSRYAPPTAPFRGFPQWGIGNSRERSAEANLKGHFLKHVLDSDPLGAELAWKDELRMWWEELDIRLERKQARQLLGLGAYSIVEQLFSAGSSSSGDATPLPFSMVTEFVRKLKAAHGQVPGPLGAALYAQYGKPFGDRALRAGRSLTDTMVHGTRGDLASIYVSGADGNMFVVGRLEGVVLGISSCYFMENKSDKLAARVPVWPLP